MYKDLSLLEKERIIKFAICSIMGLTVGKLIGFESTPTIAVSAILMLYFDRGIVGSLTYNYRRIQIQTLMGGLVILLVFIFKTLLPFDNWIIGIIVSVTAIAIGLPIDYKYKIAPLTVTLGNAVLIMTTGVLVNINYYFQRIMFCILGAIIGYIVNYVIMPQKDKFSNICNSINDNSAILINKLLYVSNNNSTVQDADIQNLKKNVGETENNIKLIKIDSNIKKYYKSPELLCSVNNFNLLQYKIIEIIEEFGYLEYELNEEFCNYFDDLINECINTHNKLLCNFNKKQSDYINPVKEKIFCADKTYQIFLLSLLFKYLKLINMLVEANNNCVFQIH